MAAIKFGDLINHRSKDYVFDLDKFMSTDGKTGVYLLYTVSRINSIMKKAEGITPRLTGVYSEAERSLILKMIMTGDVIEHAMNEKAPNYISWQWLSPHSITRTTSSASLTRTSVQAGLLLQPLPER